jgi:hypothetical protein
LRLWLASLTAKLIERNIIGNRKEPSRKLRLRLIRFSRPNDTQKDILRQLFRNFPIADQVPKQRLHTPLKAKHQLFKSRRIIILDSKH